MNFLVPSAVRVLAIVAVVLAGVAATTSSPRTVAADGECTVIDDGFDAEERAFVSLVNEYRTASGLSMLTVSASLTRAAAWMATDLGSRAYFSHADSLDRTPQQRVADCGYDGPAGENIAAGQALENAASALRVFKESPPHDDNLLFAAYVQIGVARVFTPGSRYGWYWATTFGAVDDGSSRLEEAANARPQANVSSTAAAAPPLWVNDLVYGSDGGGFYWDPNSGKVWTGEHGWHVFAPTALRTVGDLWVNDLEYASAGRGFYLDARANQVWTAECGWHRFSRSGC